MFGLFNIYRNDRWKLTSRLHWTKHVNIRELLLRPGYGHLNWFQVKLCVEEWLPESGLVTAALKIRRKQIQQFYQADIDALYATTLGKRA